TDECSLAGAVKAHVAARECGLQLLIGAEFHLEEPLTVIALAPDRSAYSELSTLITRARRRSPKGEYRLHPRDLEAGLHRCLLIWRPHAGEPGNAALAATLSHAFAGRL